MPEFLKSIENNGLWLGCLFFGIFAVVCCGAQWGFSSLSWCKSERSKIGQTKNVLGRLVRKGALKGKGIVRKVGCFLPGKFAEKKAQLLN
ncbi:hypothetical protein ACMXYQ_17510 [Neptuniibacter sp. PT34_22]|uniref:hypothetical protein n=1 Tax=Neptuniibacter sp. PT34_22 TaxID=3398205 RepID=UPI0039F544E5